MGHYFLFSLISSFLEFPSFVSCHSEFFFCLCFWLISDFLSVLKLMQGLSNIKHKCEEPRSSTSQWHTYIHTPPFQHTPQQTHANIYDTHTPIPHQHPCIWTHALPPPPWWEGSTEQPSPWTAKSATCPASPISGATQPGRSRGRYLATLLPSPSLCLVG